MNLAGTPPTTVLGSTSFVTTAPAATMAPSPIVTPCSIVTFAPSQTLSSIRIGLNVMSPRCSGSEYPLTDMGILSTIGIERRKHAECLWYVNVPKVGEQLSKLLWRVVLIIYLHSNANSLLCHPVHEEVWFATVLDRVPCCYVISIFLYCHIYLKAIMAHISRSYFSSM